MPHPLLLIIGYGLIIVIAFGILSSFGVLRNAEDRLESWLRSLFGKDTVD